MKNFSEIKFVPKGWGYEKWIVNKKEYCGKILWLAKDKKCSWHYHKLKDEVFYIRKGKLKVRYGLNHDILKCDETILEPGDNFYVPPLLVHQMLALEDTEMLEFSTQHFEEDSYRVKRGD
jgi:mannose-6-phosphate isomerase-like protein (cupin superfamily)